MFNITILPADELGPDGQRLGEVTIGSFTERFACNSPDNIEDLVASWHAQLHRLINGASAVALVHDPRFAWIVYREDDSCFIQQRFTVDGKFDPIPCRETMNEEGLQISEWMVGLDSIVSYLET